MPKLTKLTINKFRIFENQTIYFGSFLTALAGQNGTGKSNILGLVGNCVEYKRAKTRTETFFKPRTFRTEFSELFKGSKEHDPSASNLMKFYFDDDDYRLARITWQKQRFRIIPYCTPTGTNKRTSSKKKIVPMYLGLSRLYPFGEAEKCECSSLHDKSPDAAEWVMDKTCQIMSMEELGNEGCGIDSVKVNETKRKKGIGFNTKIYDSLANSAGQDNIGQILCAIWTIKTLKADLGDDFPGAILLIDEIDATLHPASQKKLFNLLTQEARHTGFQVIFTTHSLYLLEEISKKVKHNNKEDNDINKIELNYLSTANGPLRCLRNPSLEMITNDLKEGTSAYQRKIKIYTEDEENRWFLRKLLEYMNTTSRVQVLEKVSMGCDYAKSLCKADPSYFTNILFVLDGDCSLGERDTNFIKLPGDKRPESVVMDFLCDAQKTESFYSQEGAAEVGLTLRNLKSMQLDMEGSLSSERINENSNNTRARELYETWFNEHRALFDEFCLLDYWIESHPEEVQQFKNNFAKAFNTIARRLMIREINQTDGQ